MDRTGDVTVLYLRYLKLKKPILFIFGNKETLEYSVILNHSDKSQCVGGGGSGGDGGIAEIS